MPYFFLLEGGLGGGKTTTACVLAHYWRLRSGGDISLFANFDMRGATLFDKVERWVDVAQARGAVCLWDEAQTQFDRRHWNRNTSMTTILNFSRKIRAVHIFTNPSGNNLDSRILSLVEVLLRVHKADGRYVAIDVYDYQDKRFGPDGRFMKRLRIPWHKMRRIFALNLFDTDSLVYPFPTPRTERDEVKLIQDIIEAQQEAAQREKEEQKRRRRPDEWILASDRHAERREEAGEGGAGTGEYGEPQNKPRRARLSLS